MRIRCTLSVRSWNGTSGRAAPGSLAAIGACALIVGLCTARAAALAGESSAVSDEWAYARASGGGDNSAAVPAAGATGTPAPAVSPASAPPSDASAPAVTPAAESTAGDASREEIGWLDTAAGSPPENLVASPPESTAPPATTIEIPPASIDEPPKTTVDAPAAAESGDVARYEEAQRGIEDPQQLQTLRQFLSEGSISSPIGLELREARRKLDSGEEADGLLVVDVQTGSPASSAGLQGYHRTVHNVLTGIAIAAAMAFPPAIVALPALDYSQIGEHYDMIIGVDGVRVTNFLDFEDRMRDVRPGELIYLSVVRDGQRLQLRIPVPGNATDASN